MALSRQKKEEIFGKLKDVIKGNDSLVFVNFKGLGVQNTTLMRRELRQNGVSYLVAKKTLTKKALNESNVSGEMPELSGEFALVFGEESTAPSREMLVFQKKHKDNISIVGGVFEGMYKSKDEMIEIASIPSIEVLRGQFANLVLSPIQRFVGSMDEIAKAKVE